MYNSKNTAARVSQAENKGREAYLSIFSGMTWTANDERYAVWDMSGSTITTSGGLKNKFSEIKYRNIKSTQYLTTFLEVKKLNNLLDVAKANNGKAFYFVTYDDGISYLFNLSKLENKYPVSQIWCNDITIGDYPTQKIKKDIIELPLKDAARRYN